jgi:hypothetical protein
VGGKRKSTLRIHSKGQNKSSVYEGILHFTPHTNSSGCCVLDFEIMSLLLVLDHQVTNAKLNTNEKLPNAKLPK